MAISRHEQIARNLTSLLDIHGLPYTVTPKSDHTIVSTTNSETMIAVDLTVASSGDITHGDPYHVLNTQTLLEQRDSMAAELDEVKAARDAVISERDAIIDQMAQERKALEEVATTQDSENG